MLLNEKFDSVLHHAVCEQLIDVLVEVLFENTKGMYAIQCDSIRQLRDVNEVLKMIHEDKIASKKAVILKTLTNNFDRFQEYFKNPKFQNKELVIVLHTNQLELTTEFKQKATCCARLYDTPQHIVARAIENVVGVCPSDEQMKQLKLYNLETIDFYVQPWCTLDQAIAELLAKVTDPSESPHISRILDEYRASPTAKKPDGFVDKENFGQINSKPDFAVYEPEKPKKQPLRLEDLDGYGDAKTWGLELIQDIKDFKAGLIEWEDVDRGVLLSGPAGTGKTIFATALATSAEVKILHESVAKWQANGHLGDLLKAMRKAFQQAKDKAPCVLLIDELDSIGSRYAENGYHSQYVNEVINGLLECLDGAVDRDGVIVIATTNRPDDIDPAILRPGRIERHVQIPLPDSQNREKILRYHLKDHLKDADLSTVVELLDGKSGADISLLVRDARRISRRAKREMQFDDLMNNLPEIIVISSADLNRVAVHEVGHALIIMNEDLGNIKEIKINKYATKQNFDAAYVTFEEKYVSVRTLEQQHAKIRMLLGGLAAEEIAFGNRTGGSGGYAGSDLHRATMLATAIETAYCYNSLTQFSDLDDSSLLRAFYSFSDVRERVTKTLEKCLEEAKAIIKRNRTLLDHLSSELVERGKLDAEMLKSCNVIKHSEIRLVASNYVH